MDYRHHSIASHPGRVTLREQLTYLANSLGGTPKTVEVMVTRADVDGPLPKLPWRTEPKGGLAYCIEGALRLECMSEAGTHRILAFVGPGEFIPCPASPYRHGYRVRLSRHESAMIATWTPAVLREIMLTVPEGGMPSFLAKTHLGWTPHRERWAVLSMLDTRERIAVVLNDLAARFGVPDGDGVRIDVPLVDRHIAALIGTEREWVNRCINALVRVGMMRRLPDRHLWVSREFLGKTEAATLAGSATSAPT
jgi:hypothetical protein